MVARCDAYVAALDAGDVDAVMDCFSPDAVQYEPVGSEANIGGAAIRRFFEAHRTPMAVRRLGPVTVVGRHAVFQIHVRLGTGTQVVSSDVVEVDDQARFTSLAAYPDRAAAEPATAP